MGRDWGGACNDYLPTGIGKFQYFNDVSNHSGALRHVLHTAYIGDHTQII